MQKKIIQLKNVRIIYPSLFQKNLWQGKETKYQATFIIQKSNEAIKQLQEQIESIKQLKFDGKIPKTFSSCLKDIDDLRDEQDKYSAEDYNDSFILTAKSNYKPLVVENYQNINSSTGKKEQVRITDELKIKSGDYVNAFIELMPYDTPSKGISGKLLGVQFWKHGESLSKSIPNFDSFIDEENSEANDFEIPDDMGF